MASAQPENKIGTGTLLVGKYRVTRELGRGGMAAVYEAEHVNIGKRVAVKVLAAELANSAIVIERFFREARAAASVKSPYIVEVYDSGRLEDGRPFIAMELLEGESLYDRMARVRLIDPADDRPHHRPGRQGPHEGPRDRASSTAISSPRTSTSARARTARRSPRSSISGSPSSTRR